MNTTASAAAQQHQLPSDLVISHTNGSGTVALLTDAGAFVTHSGVELVVDHVNYFRPGRAGVGPDGLWAMIRSCKARQGGRLYMAVWRHPKCKRVTCQSEGLGVRGTMVQWVPDAILEWCTAWANTGTRQTRNKHRYRQALQAGQVTSHLPKVQPIKRYAGRTGG